MSQPEWKIKSIKHWEDGTWDALLISEQQGRNAYDRVISKDGFNWLTKFKKTVRDDVQTELTTCVGDMVNLGARVVVFF